MPPRNWRTVMYEVIFEADTKAGKFFDIALIICIAVSVVTVMLNSVGSINQSYGTLLHTVEWVITILFTIEYVFRLICVGKPLRYARSFYGIIDLIAILPTYLAVLIPGAQGLLVIRVLRVLRIFRVLKLTEYIGEARMLGKALRSSARKIVVFLLTVLTLVTVLGSVMYLIEGGESGFSSIPQSVYWAIVTLTTVGYGDIAPQTPAGQALASIVMILGYSIIAIPTGIVTVEMHQAFKQKVTTQSCPQCLAEGHDPDATHCKYCGSRL